MSSGSRYKELYQYDNKHSLVMDEISHDVFISKRLSHYDIEVYEYLASHHNSHIPKIINLKETDGELNVIEEYIKGNTLDVLLEDNSLSDKDRIRLFVELCEGLKFLHNAPRPVIHRDLKPSNIMVSDSGRLVIIDYDAAKIYKDDQEQDTTFLGTEGRAAPEQYGFMQSDVRTDIYAVGRMLKDSFPNDRRIQIIANKAMSFDPKDRYDSIETLLNALTRKVSAKMQLKPIFPPPGFRTGTWWKVTLAVMGYPFIIYISMGVSTSRGAVLEQYLTKVFFAIYWFVVIDICCSWTGVFDVLPFINNKSLIVRMICKTIYSVLALFVLMIPHILALGLAGVISGWF